MGISKIEMEFKIKNFDVEEYIRNLWLKIDDVDKKVFFLLFIIMNIVYFYNSFFCLFGDHDIQAMFLKIPPFIDIHAGRFSYSWLEYVISNKTIIPLFINMLLFSFLSIFIILILNWYRVPKTIFNYFFLGSFLLLSPFLYSRLFYRTGVFSNLLTLFFLMLSFFICKKVEHIGNYYKRLFYYLILIIFTTVFIFGAYPPVIGVAIGLLLGKIFIDYLDCDCCGLKNIIKKYSNIFLILFLSSFLYCVLLYCFKVNNITDSEHYSISILNLSTFIYDLLLFLKNTLYHLFISLFPYIGILYKLLFVSLIFTAFVCVFRKISEKRSYIIALFFTFLVFLFIFYSFNISYLISPYLYEKRLLRLELFTTLFFVFFCIVATIKYSNTFLKKIFLSILFVIFISNIQINMHIQKNQMIAQQYDLIKVMKMKNLILENENYEYSSNIKYEFIPIFSKTNPSIIDLYNSNHYYDYDTTHSVTEHEFLKTFLSVGVGIWEEVMTVIPPKINNINPYMKKVFFYSYDLLNSVDNDVKNWLLNDAKPYPSKNCVFISKGKIFFLMNSEILDDIHLKMRELE